MKDLLSAWPFWAAMSASFAALTAVLANMGVSGVAHDFAPLVRTLVVVAIAALIVSVTGSKPAALTSIPARSWIFLVLSGAATGLSWLCYFRAIKLGDVARVAPVAPAPTEPRLTREEAGPFPKDVFGWAILSCALFLPIGLFAVVKAASVRPQWAAGE